MKIAVTYENGNVFQHFGHTENFKVYEVEDGKILSGEVIGTDGNGHDALAGFLADKGVEVLICGGCGQGAQNALTEAGIEVCSGAAGNADEAVEMYLAGKLESAGVNCDHHDHEEEGGCGGDCGGGCSSHGCGGGCGGGQPRLFFEGPNAGKTVRVHYKGTFDSGEQFDSSYDRGEPLEFICAAGMMIPGFDKAVVDMEPGQTKDIHLQPEEAYGMPDPKAIFTVETKMIPGSENLEVGQRVHLANAMGQPFPVTVTAREGDTITFDANHEMAGKELNFYIELVEIL